MKYSKLALIALASVSVSLFHAQDSVTVADYKRAESRLFYKTAPSGPKCNEWSDMG